MWEELLPKWKVVNIGWLGIQLILSIGGSCFLPLRMAASFIESKQLFRVPDSLQIELPVYQVYAQDNYSEDMEKTVKSLRQFADSLFQGNESPIKQG